MARSYSLFSSVCGSPVDCRLRHSSGFSRMASSYSAMAWSYLPFSACANPLFRASVSSEPQATAVRSRSAVAIAAIRVGIMSKRHPRLYAILVRPAYSCHSVSSSGAARIIYRCPRRIKTAREPMTGHLGSRKCEMSGCPIPLRYFVSLVDVLAHTTSITLPRGNG